MDDDPKLGEVFFPYALEREHIFQKKNRRLVHYSSADAAIKMITNREVWMRKASCMNDFSEINYGMWCLAEAWKVEANRFREILERLYPSLVHEVAEVYNGWGLSLLHNTYVTCLSEHRPCEDELGRLSMWRAYGGGTGVAVVMNPTPFLTESHALKAYASPVGYFTRTEFHQKFTEVMNRIDANQFFLQGVEREVIKNRLFNMFLFATTCTKHPGFREELEWRVIYHPDMHASRHLTKSIETIRGVPQPVYKIPLRNIRAEIPTEGIDGIEILQLVERVIIGPTQYPTSVCEAIITTLEEAGVARASEKVFISDIPLRH